MRTLAALLLLAALLSCGPKSGQTETTPTLPGDEVAKGDPQPDPEVTPKRDPEPKEPEPAEPEEDPWADRADLIAPPPLTKPTPVDLPKIERFTLPNGLKVMIVESHELPVVSMHLAVRVGTWDESRDKRSLADFAAGMLTNGTRTHTADQLAEIVDFVGGSIGAAADLEATHVTCDAVVKHVGMCLELLPEIVATPTFPEKEMKEVRQQMLATVKQVRDSANALGAEHFENAFWGDAHVRGWPVTEATIGAITQKDLIAWHAAWFKPDNAILTVAGDVDPKVMKAALQKAFAGWKKGAKAPAHKTYAQPKLKGRRVVLIDKPDQTQSQILVGGLGIAHADKDYFATMLMNYTLGGGKFSSRLMKVVRSEGGKTYGASSAFERWKTRGTFQAATFTRNAETVATLELVLGEIDKMRTGGPDAAELADAQSNIAGNYPLNFESANRVATAVMSAELHGLGEAYVREFPVRISAVKLADVTAAAKKRLDPANALIVIVGRAIEVVPQLDAAKLPYEIVGYLEPISKRERELKKAAKTGAPDAKLAAAGKKLLDAAVKAKGGADKLKAIKDIVAKGRATLSAPDKTIEGEYVRTFTVPSKLRIDLTVKGIGSVNTVITESGGWVAAPQGSQELPPEGVALLQIGYFLQPEIVLLHHLTKGTVVQAAAVPEMVGDVPYDAVTIRSADGKSSARLLLDQQTHLIFRIYYDFDGREIYDEYGDYKLLDGLQIAYRQRNEDPVIAVPVDVVYTSIKINGGVDASVYVMPKAKKPIK